MPFLNLDDNFSEHPKVDALSDGAFRLHVSGLCYSARHLTDGFIDADKVARLVPKFRSKHLGELLVRGLWVENGPKGFAIHDFLDWNRSRVEILTDRERLRKVRSDAGRKGAAARWQK